MKGLGLKGGVIIEQVTPGGPADKAGLKAEDVIVAFNGKAVKDGDDLVNRVSTTPIGTEANVTVDRGGKNVDAKVTIADREEQLAAADDPRFSKKEEAETPGKNDVKSARFGISLRPTTRRRNRPRSSARAAALS